MDFNKIIKVFQKYVESFDTENIRIKRKIEHSYKTMEVAKELAIRLNLNKEDQELATLIGLLHDIGRFYQVAKTGGYDDRKIDHSDAGVEYLIKLGHIRDYIEESKYDSIIEKAILYHNDYQLPKNLDKRTELFCKLIRDADKIEIYRCHAQTIQNSFDREEISEDARKTFESRKCLGKINNKSEGVLRTLAFLTDMNFKESFQCLKELGYFDMYIDSIEVKKGSQEDWNYYTKISKKILEKEGI